MKKIVPLICSLTLLNACVIHVGANEPAHIQNRQLQLNANNLQQLVAETEAGDLHIIGEKGREQIEVEARINFDNIDQLELTLEAKGNAAVLIARNKEQVSFGYVDNASVDLVVRVPERFALKLEDGSGDTRVEGLTGDLLISDGSGNLQVAGGRQVTIEDGSGNLSLAQTTGNVSIDDGSGDINASQIGGTLTLTDGSGDVEISQVQGTVTIEDGSGDIRVAQAGGLTVDDDGSGELSYQQISGRITVPDDHMRE
ncbi:DUF4097 family beta strand repeat-containing protein [Rheinheimera sp. F8]|uniref:DUF4097 family beta strand repeat-containing protein n=1 Tax=Rheinheimera sp. F8 TaxID=1763998 RepID=UPI000744B0ED|nr:DUF4097 family beta strand repeat-containing protein [Rheinheimera sp. F8]ALZ74426.1 hypothetical protein ATY27_00680 [Rheinheimera sp. F8]